MNASDLESSSEESHLWEAPVHPLNGRTVDDHVVEEKTDWPVREERWGLVTVRKVGRMTILYDGETRLLVGPYWTFLLFTMSLVAVVAASVYGFVVPASLVIVRAIGLVLTGLTFVLLLATSLADPGIAQRYHVPLDKSWSYSEYAQAWRPPGTIYCRHCHLLITDYHHFCEFLIFPSLFFFASFTFLTTTYALRSVDWNRHRRQE